MHGTWLLVKSPSDCLGFRRRLLTSSVCTTSEHALLVIFHAPGKNSKPALLLDRTGDQLPAQGENDMLRIQIGTPDQPGSFGSADGGDILGSCARNDGPLGEIGSSQAYCSVR